MTTSTPMELETLECLSTTVLAMETGLLSTATVKIFMLQSHSAANPMELSSGAMESHSMKSANFNKL